jgi:hypothetical protein
MTISNISTPTSTTNTWLPEQRQKLRGLLEAQLPLHHTVLEALLTKKVAVLSNNMHAIQEIDSYLKQCNKQLLKLEQERMQLLSSFGITEADCKLEAIIASLSHSDSPTLQQERKEWMQLHLSLQHVVRQVGRASQEVGELLAISMGWVKRSIDTLRQATTQQAGQSYSGVTARGGKGYMTKPKAPLFQASLHHKEA